MWTSKAEEMCKRFLMHLICPGEEGGHTIEQQHTK